LNLEIEQFYKIANQLQFIFNPINLLEYFVLTNGTGLLNRRTPS